MKAERSSIPARRLRRARVRIRRREIESESLPGELLGPSLTLATYNLHRCVGVDRRYDPGRIASVLRELNADIIGLQEVAVSRQGHNLFDQCAFLAEAAGLFSVSGPHLIQYRSRFSNALLTRLPVLRSDYIDLSVSGCPPRGALDVELDAGDRILRVIATHLGLGGAERKLQTEHLLGILEDWQRRPEDALLIMGDLNEWRGRRGGIPSLDRAIGRSPAMRTFPAWCPILPLDRIYATKPAVLFDFKVHRSALARLASDHLPLRARLGWRRAA